MKDCEVRKAYESSPKKSDDKKSHQDEKCKEPDSQTKSITASPKAVCHRPVLLKSHLLHFLEFTLF